MSNDALISTEMLDIMRHGLGMDEYGQYGRAGAYRNRYCAGGDDVALCQQAVAMGLMTGYMASKEFGGYYTCQVAEAGKAAIARLSPPSPKLTAGQKRYKAYLASDLDCSFGEFLAHLTRMSKLNIDAATYWSSKNHEYL